MINLTHYYDVTKCLNELLKFQNSLNLKYTPKVISDKSIHLLCSTNNRYERVNLLQQLSDKIKSDNFSVDDSRLNDVSRGSNYWYLIVNKIKVYCKSKSRTQYTASTLLRGATVKTINDGNSDIQCYSFGSDTELKNIIETNIDKHKKLNDEEKLELKKLLSDPLGKNYIIPDAVFYPLSEIYVPLLIMANQFEDSNFPYQKIKESSKTLYFPTQTNYPIVDAIIECRHNNESFRISLSAKVDKGAKGSLFSLLKNNHNIPQNTHLHKLFSNSGNDLEKIWKYFFDNGDVLLKHIKQDILTDEEKTSIFNTITKLKQELPNLKINPNIDNLANASYIMCCTLASRINNSEQDIKYIKTVIKQYDYYQYKLSNKNGFVDVKFVDKTEFDVKIYGNKSSSQDINLAKGRLNFELS